MDAEKLANYISLDTSISFIWDGTLKKDDWKMLMSRAFLYGAEILVLQEHRIKT
jgi:hypothetical protein